MTAPHPVIVRAQTLLNADRPADAERELITAIGMDRRNPELQKALAVIYLRSGRLAEGADVLWRVTSLEPKNAQTYHTLAEVLARLGRTADMTELYRRLVANYPDDALAHYNLACCLRGEGKLHEALDSHRRALDLGLARAEEALTNIGVILGQLHRHDEARQAFDQALARNPAWIPALYNLGLWHEEHGDRAAAERQFEAVLAVSPGFHDALVRLAYLQKVDSRDHPIVKRLRDAVMTAPAEAGAAESLRFALGKALDDCAAYEEAFEQYRLGNERAKARSTSYSKSLAEEQFQSIREGFTADWLDTGAAVPEATPVFVCGMFRSGTTLLAQMLAGHPGISDGGEIGWFHGRLPWRDTAWPAKLTQSPVDDLRNFAQGYVQYLTQTFPGRPIVIDQRPDNFLLIGLLRGLYPNGRFIHMVRDARDTGLSIYFQQFEDAFGYVNDLADIAHFVRQYQALMEHWRSLPGASGWLHEVHYETLVREPRSTLQQVCAFLGIDWDDAVMAYHDRASRVRTASVWQVREPLTEASIGRWRHYAAHLGPLAALEPETGSP